MTWTCCHLPMFCESFSDSNILVYWMTNFATIVALIKKFTWKSPWKELLELYIQKSLYLLLLLGHQIQFGTLIQCHSNMHFLLRKMSSFNWLLMSNEKSFIIWFYFWFLVTFNFLLTWTMKLNLEKMTIVPQIMHEHFKKIKKTIQNNLHDLFVIYFHAYACKLNHYSFKFQIKSFIETP